jgi:hypothetical protein
MDRNAREDTVTKRHQQLADVAKHDDATVAYVSDDELVEGRARNTFRTLEHADTDVADELSVNAELAYSVIATVDDYDVKVSGHEAQSTRRHQLTVTRTDEEERRHAG